MTIASLINIFQSAVTDPRQKYQTEARFWKKALTEYVAWYEGKTKLYGVSSPEGKNKIIEFSNTKKNAAATWNKVYQEKRYLDDFQVSANYFRGMRILDIGCGPHPSALCFKNCRIYGLDHLIDTYREIGFPIDEYKNKFHFIQAKSESIPFESDFFDVVIATNAIDHIDNLKKTSQEIKRVLKPNGKFRMHVHYHQPTPTEPIVINDDLFWSTFKWVKNLEKIKEFKSKDLGFTKLPPGQNYVLWGN